MFGIGLPEMILIMALALIVVGPDKLPDLARSLAKGLMELKKTAEGLKDSLTEEGNPLDEIRPDLEEAARNFKSNLLDTPPYQRDEIENLPGVNPPENGAAQDTAADAYEELMQQTPKLSSTEPASSVASEHLTPQNSDTPNTEEEPETTTKKPPNNE